MPKTDTAGAQALLERIRTRVEGLSPQALGVQTAVTVSLGLATASHQDASFDQLYARADQALYEAKTNGRNCVVID